MPVLNFLRAIYRPQNTTTARENDHQFISLFYTGVGPRTTTARENDHQFISLFYTGVELAARHLPARELLLPVRMTINLSPFRC